MTFWWAWSGCGRDKEGDSRIRCVSREPTSLSLPHSLTRYPVTDRRPSTFFSSFVGFEFVPFDISFFFFFCFVLLLPSDLDSLPFSSQPQPVQSRTHRSDRRNVTNITRSSADFTFTMGHEDAVYLAKLAEQAERYEGSFVRAIYPRIRIDHNQRWSRT